MYSACLVAAVARSLVPGYALFIILMTVTHTSNRIINIIAMLLE
jgi:hypothetical protein